MRRDRCTSWAASRSAWRAESDDFSFRPWPGVGKSRDASLRNGSLFRVLFRRQMTAIEAVAKGEGYGVVCETAAMHVIDR